MMARLLAAKSQASSIAFRKLPGPAMDCHHSGRCALIPPFRGRRGVAEPQPCGADAALAFRLRLALPCDQEGAGAAVGAAVRRFALSIFGDAPRVARPSKLASEGESALVSALVTIFVSCTGAPSTWLRVSVPSCGVRGALGAADRSREEAAEPARLPAGELCTAGGGAAMEETWASLPAARSGDCGAGAAATGSVAHMMAAGLLGIRGNVAESIPFSGLRSFSGHGAVLDSAGEPA